MFYVIQTNTSINNGSPVDFQSYMYKITNQTWEEFKQYIMSNEDFTEKIIKGTMMGSTKPSNCIVEKVLINDEIHLEVIKTHGKDNHMKSNSKYYLVEENRFKNLVK
jgi:hypothetical protein